MISYAFLKININVLNHCDIVLSRSSPSQFFFIKQLSIMKCHQSTMVITLIFIFIYFREEMPLVAAHLKSTPG